MQIQDATNTGWFWKRNYRSEYLMSIRGNTVENAFAQFIKRWNRNFQEWYGFSSKSKLYQYFFLLATYVCSRFSIKAEKEKKYFWYQFASTPPPKRSLKTPVKHHCDYLKSSPINNPPNIHWGVGIWCWTLKIQTLSFHSLCGSAHSHMLWSIWKIIMAHNKSSTGVLLTTYIGRLLWFQPLMASQWDHFLPGMNTLHCYHLLTRWIRKCS